MWLFVGIPNMLVVLFERSLVRSLFLSGVWFVQVLI
jgi:hypothetical protein